MYNYHWWNKLVHLTRCSFGFIPSFFLELFLHWSPVAYWVPTDLGSSSFSILSFCLFTLLMGFSRQEYWSGLPFPSPEDHILSDLSTMTCPSWVAPQGMAWFHWVRPGCGPSVIRLTSFLWLWFQCICLLMPSCNTYHLTWVSLTLDVRYLFMTTPYLGRGISPHRHPSWPWTWSSSSRPSFILLVLLLSHFSRVQLCATPETAPHQAPPSLGFSRQEHWSGLPFPSPMHESAKWKWSRSVVSNS